MAGLLLNISSLLFYVHIYRHVLDLYGGCET